MYKRSMGIKKFLKRLKNCKNFYKNIFWRKMFFGLNLEGLANRSLEEKKNFLKKQNGANCIKYWGGRRRMEQRQPIKGWKTGRPIVFVWVLVPQ